MYFYPRSPCGERPFGLPATSLAHRDFYPRSPCGERPQRRAGLPVAGHFYPRSPCGERLFASPFSIFWICHFYPRSPCGERHNINSSVNTADKISIHALLAESDAIDVFLAVWAIISIHALLAESDGGAPSSCFGRITFLSTLSLRRATVLVWCSSGGASDFYPRSPCGERRSDGKTHVRNSLFLSTLSLRRATALIPHQQKSSDGFLSTLSLRRATAAQVLRPPVRIISIHALLAESDWTY